MQPIAGKAALRRAAVRIHSHLMPGSGEPHQQLSGLLALEGLLAASVANLATSYTQMFASRLGATDTQIGYINALPQLLALLVLIPGALLASRVRDRRKPVEAAIIVYGVLFGVAGLSPWMGDARVWFLIGTLALANAPVALYNTTWQSYFSNIVPVESRNACYARRTGMTFFAGIIIVQALGILLGGAPSDAARIWLYQGCYWLAFVVALAQLAVLRRSPADKAEHVATGWRDLLAAGREIAGCRPFMLFALIALLFHAGWYMSWPLFFINQIDYLGANETWISLIAVPAGILQWLTTRPWGRFIERHGVRLTLVIGCLGLTVNPMLAVLAAVMPAGVKLPAMLVLNLVSGATFSAFQLSILQCMLEVLPPRFRTINISFYTSLILLANALSPVLGVRLYTALGADLRAMALSMLVSSLIRLVGTALFLLRWRRLRGQTDCGRRI